MSTLKWVAWGFLAFNLLFLPLLSGLGRILGGIPRRVLASLLFIFSLTLGTGGILLGVERFSRPTKTEFYSTLSGPHPEHVPLSPPFFTERVPFEEHVQAGLAIVLPLFGIGLFFWTFVTLTGTDSPPVRPRSSDKVSRRSQPRRRNAVTGASLILLSELKYALCIRQKEPTVTEHIDDVSARYGLPKAETERALLWLERNGILQRKNPEEGSNSTLVLGPSAPMMAPSIPPDRWRTEGVRADEVYYS